MARVAEPALKFTKSDFDRLPEDFRVELIDGSFLKMATPTVRHQVIVGRLYVRLLELVGERRVLLGTVGFVVNDGNVLGPDLVAFDEGLAPAADARDVDQALLVFEVQSPSTAARDRRVKADLYLAADVREVWLIDPAKRTIEIRTPAGTRVVQGREAAVSEALPGFAVRPADIF